MSDQPTKRALYLKNRYHNDPEYREYRKAMTKKRYQSKTIKCEKCTYRYKRDGNEISPETNICIYCLNGSTKPTIYIGGKVGRPKIYSNKE